MTPVIKVWCLPRLSQKRLRTLHKEIVRVAVGVKGLNLKDEEDLVVPFPPDMMYYGLGSEIYIEITEVWADVKSQDRVILISNLGALFKQKFPKARILVHAIPFNCDGGTWVDYD